GVLHAESVLESVELWSPNVERRLAALEPRRDPPAGPRLLALGAAAGRLAAARPMASPHAPRRLVGAGPGLQLVQLHDPKSSGLAPPAGATSRRKATRLIMPRLVGVSSMSTLWCNRCSPRARMVPRAAALCPISDRTHVTRSVPFLSATAASHRESGRRSLDHLVWRACPLRPTLAEELLSRLAAVRGDGVRRAQRAQRVHGGAHHVDRVGAAHRLGEQVADPGGLDHRAHRTAGDDAGARRRGLENHVRGTEVALDDVGNGGANQRDSDEVLLGVLDALADRLRDLAALAQAGPDHAVAVTHHDYRAEAEAAPAPGDLGDAVDLDDLLFQVELGWIDSSHGFLRYRSRPPSRAPSASERTRPWYWYPPRSRTTAFTPAAFARSATALPTAWAGASLPPSASRPAAPASSASRDEAAARARPLL